MPNQITETKNKNIKIDTGLSKFDIFCLVVGSIIGLGSFVLPGALFLPKYGVISTGIGLCIGGLFVIIIQKAYQVMLANHIGNGGEFSYTLNNMGNIHGFVVGWSLSLCYLSLIPLNATACLLVLKKIFAQSFNWGYMYNFGETQVFFTDIVIASVPIIVFLLINLRGLSLSSKIQNIMSSALVFIVIALFFITMQKSDMQVFLQNYAGYSEISFGKIAAVVAISPFLFVGFDVVPQVSSDLGFKPAKAHRITMFSIIVGILLYSLLNVTAAFSYSPIEAKLVDWAVAASVMEKAGITGFLFLLIAVFSAVTGGINGFMISSSKLTASLAEHKLCPAFLSKKNKKGIYSNSLLFISVVSLIGPWVGREVIILIVDMTSVLAAIAYTYVGFIGIKKAVSKFDKILCLAGFVIGMVFIVLLLLPGSPARLSAASVVFLMTWAVLGCLFFIFTTKKFRKEEI